MNRSPAAALMHSISACSISSRSARDLRRIPVRIPSGSSSKLGNVVGSNIGITCCSRHPSGHCTSKAPRRAFIFAQRSGHFSSLSTIPAKERPPADNASRRSSVLSCPPPSVIHTPCSMKFPITLPSTTEAKPTSVAPSQTTVRRARKVSGSSFCCRAIF